MSAVHWWLSADGLMTLDDTSSKADMSHLESGISG